MSAARKADAAEVVAILEKLAAAPWLGRARADWARTVYHYSDIRNIAAILRSGYVRSRRKLELLNAERTEIADQQIINSSPWAHRYARFYLRPRTPMQHRVEGIRPCRPDGSPASPHCPVPVFLLFNSHGLMTREACIYTSGNFASTATNAGIDADFLRKRDFRRIYHDEAFTPDERDAIVHARCTEVLFENEVDLDDLRCVVCRTAAERTTLLTLLGDAVGQWAPRIRLEKAGERLFFRSGTYVSEVQFTPPRSLLVKLRVASAGEHQCNIRLRLPSGQVREATLGPPLQPTTRINLPADSPLDGMYIEVTISGALAYCGHISQQSLYTP